MTDPKTTDLVGKEHAEQTQNRWVKDCGKAQCDPDPSGGFVAFLCDSLQGYVDGKCELDATLQHEVKQRCKAVGLNPLHVWNALVALALTLPRKDKP